VKAKLLPVFRKISDPAMAALTFLVCLSAILLLGNLGSLRQFTKAEVCFAETAREMLLSGDYITPRFCEEIFFDKPPFLYWLIALSMKVFGETEASTRLPSALAGVVTVLLTSWFARRRYGNRAGFLAGAILITCPIFWSFSRQAMSDAWLMLCVSAALFAYHDVLKSDDAWKRSLIVGHLFLATSMLVKGPVGIALTGLPVLAALFFCPRGRWKRFLFPPGILVFLLVATPWYLAAAWKHGSFFWNYFIFRENVGRFLGSSYQTSHETYVYYPIILLKHAFPWSLWLPTCIWGLFKSRHVDSEQGFTSKFLFLWFAAPILFFSISRFQIYYYILPCLPALAIIVGAGLARYTIQPIHLSGKILAVLIALSFAVLAFFFWRNSIILFPDIAWTDHIVLPLIALAGTVLILFATFYRPAILPYSIALTAGLLILFADWGNFPRLSRYLSVQQFAHRIASMQEKETLRVATCIELAYLHPDVRFYTGLPAESNADLQAVRDFVAAPGRAFLIIYEKYLPEIFGNGTIPYKIVDRGLYLKHGLPSLNYFQHPITPNATVLVEINN
jgi:4-amino-4-deoxy-L-arabinose transferase-like glycosyltransferase